jgi:hypothetical protein
MVNNVWLHLRVGNQTDVASTIQAETYAIYYDLANKDWSVVKIAENGWQIEHSPPITYHQISL